MPSPVRTGRDGAGPGPVKLTRNKRAINRPDQVKHHEKIVSSIRNMFFQVAGVALALNGSRSFSTSSP